MSDTVIQIIGFFGVFLFLISYQVKSNKLLFVIQTFGCLTFAVQFALLGAYSACVTSVISIIKSAMLIKYEQSRVIRWKGWVAVFSAACIITAMFTWDGILSLLPIIATVANIVGCWTNNAKKLRISVLFISSPCMLLYDVLVMTWGGVLNETITIISIVVSIIRFGWKALDGSRIK